MWKVKMLKEQHKMLNSQKISDCPDLSKQDRPENKVRPLILTLTLRAVLSKSQVPVLVCFSPCCELVLSKPDLDTHRYKWKYLAG